MYVYESKPTAGKRKKAGSSFIMHSESHFPAFQGYHGNYGKVSESGKGITQFVRVINLEPGDEVLDRSVESYTKDRKDVTEGGALGIDEELRIYTHGSNPISGSYVYTTSTEENKTGAMTPSNLAEYVAGLGIIPDGYVGTIYINGCYTATTYRDRSTYPARTVSFITEFKAELTRALNETGITFQGRVMGNNGGATTTKTGREAVITAGGCRRTGSLATTTI